VSTAPRLNAKTREIYLVDIRAHYPRHLDRKVSIVSFLEVIYVKG
jgi:hypothetical protein